MLIGMRKLLRHKSDNVEDVFSGHVLIMDSFLWLDEQLLSSQIIYDS